MPTVSTEGGEKAKEKIDQKKERENHNLAIAKRTTETERLLAINPNRRKEKARTTKKAKEEEWIREETGPTKPAAIATFQDTMLVTAGGGNVTKKENSNKRQLEKAKKQQEIMQFKSSMN